MKQQLKQWWLDIRTLFEVTVGVSTLDITVRVVVLDCRLDVGLWFSHMLDWVPPIMLFRGRKTWHRKVGRNKSFSIGLDCDGCLSTGFSFSKHIHCDHSPCRLSLELLGVILKADYRDVRHWDDKNNTYEELTDE